MSYRMIPLASEVALPNGPTKALLHVVAIVVWVANFALKQIMRGPSSGRCLCRWASRQLNVSRRPADRRIIPISRIQPTPSHGELQWQPPITWQVARSSTAIAVLTMFLVVGLITSAAHSPGAASGGDDPTEGTVEFIDPSCSEWPEVAGKDVGSCSCALPDPTTLQVILSNAYPYYGCDVNFQIRNQHDVIMVIEHIAVNPHNFTDGVEVSIEVLDIYEGQGIDPWMTVHGTLLVWTEQPAQQNFDYTFTVTIILVQDSSFEGGTIGFWGAWNKHNTYTEAEINEWLSDIDSHSSWLVPDKDGNGIVDVHGMEAIFGKNDNKKAKKDSSSDMEQRFLSHYLATRLDVAAGTLDTGGHDFTSCDDCNYLGLDGSGTLQEIITAIEGKHGTSPTADEFEIMKDICVALNEVTI